MTRMISSPIQSQQDAPEGKPTMTIGLAARTAALSLVAAALVAGVAAPAGADDQFGDHVRTCVQTEGFDGAHNPGMHQGASGWTPDHAC